MAEIVNLRTYRTRMVEQRGFGPWQKRFGETYDQKTILADLSDKTLYLLAQPGEEYSVAFYELIMGILGIGKALKFYYLDEKEQIMVMNSQLFLADQVRFEMMRRLGWLKSFPCDSYSLLEIVEDFDKVDALCKRKIPEIAAHHPNYPDLKEIVGMDREVLIRRMLPEALEAFKQRL